MSPCATFLHGYLASGSLLILILSYGIHGEFHYVPMQRQLNKILLEILWLAMQVVSLTFPLSLILLRQIIYFDITNVIAATVQTKKDVMDAPPIMLL
jgi:hypothetical protein